MTSNFGKLPVYQGAVSSDGLVVNKTYITQGTSLATGVTANGSAGVITTYSTTDTGAGAASAITLTNSSIKADSIVLAQVIDYAGTFGTGLPVVAVDAIAAGSCDIVLMNPDAAALDSVVKIAFQVL